MRIFRDNGFGIDSLYPRIQIESRIDAIFLSDFEKYFIKAEVISWQDLLAVGGFANARDKGLIRIEGKDYIMGDGDVIEIKSGR